MEDYVLVKLPRKTVDIMCVVYGKYQDYVGMEVGKKVLYIWLTKVLYGCMQSTILWYETLKECFEKICFKLNKYD